MRGYTEQNKNLRCVPMNPIVLVAETGSDLTPEKAKEYGVELVPMHVAFGGETYDDGSFPVTDMFDYYKKHRELPRTSGCTPADFEKVFDRIEREHPGAPILHLAYSACTTCSMQSALLAAEGRENIVSVDTKCVSAGQAAVVLRVARLLREHPEMTVEQAVAATKEISERVRMGFFPGDLDYLRAGGRVSNAAYLGAKILGLNPLIEIQDGKLISTKKYRGSMARVVSRLVSEYPAEQGLEKDELFLIYGKGLDEAIMRETERSLHDQGYENLEWVQTGCVISAHGGPGAFGIAGFAR